MTAMITSATHRQVQAETKQARNDFQRLLRHAPVLLLRVPYQGEVLLVAVSRRTPQVGYVLTPGPDGRLSCTCPGFAFRRDCAHVQAASRPREEHV